MIEVRFKRLHAEAKVPTYATSGAAGMDLCAWIPNNGAVLLRRGERMKVRTQLSVELPDGHEGQVRPRSGLAAKYGITVLNAPGTLDADFRGEICVLLVNLGDEAFPIAHGERIAQFVVSPVLRVAPIEVAELSATERGAGGFGSTGRG